MTFVYVPGATCDRCKRPAPNSRGWRWSRRHAGHLCGDCLQQANR